MGFRQKRAMRLADKGDYGKAQKVASRIRDGRTSLDTKIAINRMQNEASGNPFDEFSMKRGGKTPMRDTLLNRISRK